MKGEILVLAHTPNDANQIEGHLRSAGHAIHVLVAPGLDSFSDIIEKSEICVAIHDAKYTDCDLIQVAEAVYRSKPDIPLLQLSDSVNSRSSADAMSKGAHGVISLANPVHLELSILRVYETYSLRREVALLREKMTEIEDVRTQDLGTTSAPGLRVQEGIVVTANAALANALSFGSPDDLIGYPLMDLIDKPDQAKIKQLVKDCMKGRGNDEAVQFTLVGEHEARRSLQARFIRIEHEGDPALEIRGLESEAAMPAVAADGAPARLAMYQAITQQGQMTSAGQVPVLVFIALDEYEQIEQRAGFAGAEEVVAEAIRMLSTELIASDQLFRFSLSEVVVLGQRDTAQTVSDLVNHFQRAVARHVFKAADKEISCTASVVIYPLSADAEDAEELLRKIRGEVKALEDQGGSGLKMIGSTAEDLERRQASAAWLARIQQALKENRFDLAYQNIASLAGEDRQFSDILLRMLDEDGTERLAREFLPSAEEHGLMPQIDRWVVTRAAQVIEQQLKERKDPCFFVRVAEDTLAEGAPFVAWLEALVKAHPKLVGHLVLIIRERHLETQMNRAQALIAKANALGLSTALDHFGTSRHSAQLLARLKPTYVKLHADFTESISSSGGDVDALSVIMEQARQHKVKTIAERVTDANGMARLWQMGVNYIMGSHVHEPDRELTRTRFRLN